METRNDWLTRALPILALVAFLVVAASTEYALALDVMKLPWPIAVGVPVAIDCYVVAAFRAGRDVRLAMVVTAASLAGATGWHMATAGTDDWARFALAGLVLMLLVVVLWRVHVITGHAGPIDAPIVETRSVTVTVTATRSTRSTAYLPPPTYVRMIDPSPIGSIEATRSAVESIRAIGADPIRTPIRSTATVRSIDPAPRSDRPLPDRGQPARSSHAWIGRSSIDPEVESDRSQDAVLADLRSALTDEDPIPSAEAIRSHYRIAPARARVLRDQITRDRRQRAAGGVEGEPDS